MTLTAGSFSIFRTVNLKNGLVVCIVRSGIEMFPVGYGEREQLEVEERLEEYDVQRGDCALYSSVSARRDYLNRAFDIDRGELSGYLKQVELLVER